MTITDIAVHAPMTSDFSGPVAYAAALATRWCAGLTGIHVLPPLDALGFADDPQTLAALAGEHARRRDAARAAAGPFTDFARDAGAPRSHWMVAEGAVPESLAWAASGTDLLVLGADPQLEDDRAELDRTVIEARLPCLVVPKCAQPGATAFTRVAIAWNGSVEAWRALASALPLLRDADAIVLLDGSDPRSLRGVDLWDPPDVAAWLRRHGLVATRVRIEGEDAGSQLLARAQAFDARLIVMGAYGRSRFAEWLLGGVTRHMLRHATVPVLLRH